MNVGGEVVESGDGLNLLHGVEVRHAMNVDVRAVLAVVVHAPNLRGTLLIACSHARNVVPRKTVVPGITVGTAFSDSEAENALVDLHAADLALGATREGVLNAGVDDVTYVRDRALELCVCIDFLF